MIRKILLCVLVSLIFTGAFAQNVFQGIERGGLLGASHYIGDINPKAQINRPHLAIGGLIKHNFSNYISLGLQLDFSKISYADSLNNSTFEKNRNLSFQSYVAGLKTMVEFNFFRFQTGNFRFRWTPYAGTGIGVLYYNPYVDFEGARYYLRDLGTEGQFISEYSDRKYNSLSAYIPISFGLKYWMRPGMNFAVEFFQKFTFTDYLDDVSTSYVGAENFIYNGRKDASYYLQDRSPERLDNAIGIRGRQRGTSTDNDKIFGIQIKLTFIPSKYVCPQ